MPAVGGGLVVRALPGGRLGRPAWGGEDLGKGRQGGLKEGTTEAPTPGARADGECGRRGGGTVQPGGVGGARSCPASARTWALGPEDRSGLAQAPPRGAGKIRHHIPFRHIQPVLEWPWPAWERMWPLEQPPNTGGTWAASCPPPGPGPAFSALRLLLTLVPPPAPAPQDGGR